MVARRSARKRVVPSSGYSTIFCEALPNERHKRTGHQIRLVRAALEAADADARAAVRSSASNPNGSSRKETHEMMSLLLAASALLVDEISHSYLHNTGRVQ